MTYNTTQLKRIEQGLCIACGIGHPTNGKKHCDTCSASRAIKQKAIRAPRRQKGLCQNCGNLAIKGRSRCSNCKRRDKEYRTKRANLFRLKKQCSVCGAPPLLALSKNERYILCEKCYLKKRSQQCLGSVKYWVQIRDKLQEQQFQCAYTGDEIVLGVNDSLDHILPLHHFPKLASDIDNIAWVTRKVNEMKRDRTPEEFISLILKIAAYRS